jgi:hypothetical protein
MPNENVRKHDQCGCVEMNGWHYHPETCWVVEVSGMFPLIMDEPEQVLVQGARNEIAAKLAAVEVFGRKVGLMYRVIDTAVDMVGCCRVSAPCLRCEEPPTADELMTLIFGAGLAG